MVLPANMAKIPILFGWLANDILILAINFPQGVVVSSCLILISLPMVTSEFIEYPLEDGPYTVIIIGKTYGGAVSKPLFWDHEIGFQLGPFCKYKYPFGPEYNMLNRSIFIVNGKIRSKKNRMRIAA
jgi:hypothetical protein